MNRSFLWRAAIAFALITGATGSALSSDAAGDIGATYDQILDRFEITALIFKPAQPGTMSAVISDMHLTPQGDDAGGNGQYVLDAADRAEIMSVLHKYGKVERQLHSRGPLGDDGRAGAFSRWPERQFSASLKTRYIPSVKQKPPAFIMDYSLKASLEHPLPGEVETGDSARLRYTSTGSMLLPDKGALMSIRETSSGFLIWILSAY
ncbi:hypothetical protein [Candidatus Pantoea floridensis]|uniref:Uncharacterized protein n=1 Tax=Candidatus Pantoea floridensis TaxID=1938870 RepID=A0A286DRW7_9GAMM|nr:hypothetical protein [Pantoea floridensis]PIF06889.1 hypothetical protein BX596_5189 [Enterobacteriaceae bacterium JKS000233]SOD61427.1 hypothetical protein SAMN06273570_5129 [Pantoea floridensis]